MDTQKKIIGCILMQFLILSLHFFIHMNINTISILGLTVGLDYLCSFIATTLITFVVALKLKLPIFSSFIIQVFTFIYIYIFDNEGAYLIYYLHAGSSLFNPGKLTDAIIVCSVFLMVQLPTIILAKLVSFIHSKNYNKKTCDVKIKNNRLHNPKEYAAQISLESFEIIDCFNNRIDCNLANMFSENLEMSSELSFQIEKAFETIDGTIISYNVVPRCHSKSTDEYIIKSIKTDSGKEYEFYIMRDIKTRELLNIWIHYTIDGMPRSIYIGNNPFLS